MKRFFKKNIYLFLLFLICVFVYWRNYQPGTWLTGWDNLHPELNPRVNIKNSFFAIWQEYRGLACLDGKSDAANILYVLFISLLSFILPSSFIRYFFHFGMHFLGGVGVYQLARFLLIKKKKNTTSLNGILCFIVSAFYLFNFGTTQIFYLPFEVFSIHFAALPWLTLFLLKTLRKRTKKKWLWFFILSLLSTPQAYVPTLFIVYLLILLIICLFHLNKIKRLLTVIAIVFCTNAFWGLPYVYSAIKNTKIITNSKINQMSTQDTQLKNKSFGDFKSVSLIQGLVLDYVDLQPSGEADYIMKSWQSHFEKPLVQITSWIFFAVSLIGLISVLRKKEKSFYPFVVLFILTFFILGNDIPYFAFIADLATDFIPLFGIIFRNVFTKFSLPYILCYALFLGKGLKFLATSCLKIGFKKDFPVFLGILLFLSLFFYSWPIFQGNFLYSNLRIKIPPAYFKFIDYMQNQNQDTRLVLLPQTDFWGWSYYSWGFRGVNFLWHALPQSTMDGAFMPWSKDNENFYWQISQAIYSQDLAQFESVLEKYQINWLVLDENLGINFDAKALYLPQLERFLGDSEIISLEKKFGTIRVYKTNLRTSVEDFVFLTTNLPQVNSYNWNNKDTAFLDYGYYLSDSMEQGRTDQASIFYPFRSLFTGRLQEELEFNIKDTGEAFIFAQPQPAAVGYRLQTPELDLRESYFVTSDLEKEKMPEPLIKSDQGWLAVEVKKKKGYLSYDSQDYPEDIFKTPVKSCDPFNTGEMKRQLVKQEKEELLRFDSIGSSNCLQIELPFLSQEIGYLVKVESRHLLGKGLLFYMMNQTFSTRFLETYLPQDVDLTTSYFIIPPMGQYGMGYSLNFDNISIGRQETINDLGRVEVYPIPYRFLKNIKLVSNQALPATSYQLPASVKHPNPSFYKINLDSGLILNTNYLILSQSYHPGWLAFYKDNNGKWQRLTNHVKVNNWENGWQLNDGVTTIYLLFWPQLLEYLGFVLLGGFILFLVFKKDKQK